MVPEELPIGISRRSASARRSFFAGPALLAVPSAARGLESIGG